MTSSEQEFLNNYHPEDYEKPSVAVDLLVFTIEEAALKLVMIRREEMPFQNKLALPGVFVNIRESLEEAAYRGIEEETGLTDIYLEQLYTWGDPERDPRMRIISVSYMALVHIHKIHLSKGKRTTQVSLYPVEELLAEETEIAFDHKKMIACARERIKIKRNIRMWPSPFCRKNSPFPSFSGFMKSCWEKNYIRPISVKR